MALSFNRDLFTSDQVPFYRELKNDSFDYIFEVNANLSGYSRDVHGQLTVLFRTSKEAHLEEEGGFN